MSEDKNLGLEDAYAVKTPDDNLALYRDWASTYDSEFAATRGYQYPQLIADVYSRKASKEDTPVLDVGAGTGLAAVALLEHSDIDSELIIDGIDISPEMLEVSKEKDIYQRLFEADLTKRVDLPDDYYGAVISVGTFTHGHVGPDALYELLRMSKPGALFVIGVNGTAFDKYHFGSGFASLQADGYITPLQFIRVQYYANAEDDHADDQGYAAVFRKT
ncbi:MAG: class I SAM-dependent methyltransferase [Pseudomonadales bacterium]